MTDCRLIATQEKRAGANVKGDLTFYTGESKGEYISGGIWMAGEAWIGNYEEGDGFAVNF